MEITFQITLNEFITDKHNDLSSYELKYYNNIIFLRRDIVRRANP